MNLIEDDIDLSAYMGEEADGNSVKPAGDWMDQVIDHFHAPRENRFRPKLPWHKTKNIFEFRPGEVTIVGGINGHGKSVLWGQVILALSDQGEKVCVASLEMKPRLTMARMCKQAAGEGEPSIPFLRQTGRWLKDKLWIYDKVGQCKPEKILAVIRYVVDKFGITHFVLDNLTKVIPGETGDGALNGQKDFVNQLCTLAQDLNIHITLVMHVRKSEDENKPPSKMDLKGAGSVTDMVDNVFIVWRNKGKEKSIRKGKIDKIDEPDCLLILEKQRNGEGEENEGTFLFWFDRGSNQYLEDRHARPEPLRAIHQHIGT